MRLLKEKINFIILFLLFFLQETQEHNILTAVLLLVLLVVNVNTKIKFPHVFVLSIFLYMFYLIRGFLYNHANPTIDIKFHVFFLLLLIAFFNIKKFNYLNFFFIINITVLIIYILLYFKLIPNLWHDNYFGYKSRLYGPSITAFIYIAFIYLFEKRTLDKKLMLSFFVALIYVLLTTNFMNLIIIVALFLLIIVDLKKILNFKTLLGVLTGVIVFVLLIQSPYIPELSKDKLKYLSNPLEYPSLKIRVTDLRQAIENEQYTNTELLFGKGFGANTTIYRENKIARSLSKWITFQEIDNGFYYLFHRGGFSLLLLYLLISLYFLLKIPSINAKIGFLTIFVFTNTLSIHMFNYIFYVFIIYYIMNHPKSIKFKI